MSLSRSLSRTTNLSVFRPFVPGVVVPAVPPTVVSITPTIEGDRTNHTPALPATVAAGDLLLMLTATDDGGNDIPTTEQDGWSRIAAWSKDAGSAIFIKKAVGNEGGTTLALTTPTAEFMSAQCYRISTWSGNLDDVKVGTAVSVSAGASVAPPSLTTGWGAVPTLWVAFAGLSTLHGMISGPDNYEGLTSTGGSGTNNAQVRSAWRQLTAASEHPGPFVHAGTSNWCAATVAVRGTV